MLARLTALLFVIAVIGAEVLIASLWLSSSTSSQTTQTDPHGAQAAEDVANTETKHGHEAGTKENHESAEKKHGTVEKNKHGATGKNSHAKSGHSQPGESAAKIIVDPLDQIEVDLEQFYVTTQSVASNSTMRVEFHLYGVIKAGDKEEFDRLVKASQHRIRDQILTIIRSAHPRDLSDAGLGLIKRQILEKTNAILGKPLLREVIVSDFAYLEQ